MVRVFAAILAIAVLFSTAPIAAFAVFAAESHAFAGPASVSTVERARSDDRRDQTGHDQRSCSIVLCASAIARPIADGVTARHHSSRRNAVLPESPSLRGVALSTEPPVPRIALFQAR